MSTHLPLVFDFTDVASDGHLNYEDVLEPDQMMTKHGNLSSISTKSQTSLQSLSVPLLSPAPAPQPNSHAAWPKHDHRQLIEKLTAAPFGKESIHTGLSANRVRSWLQQRMHASELDGSPRSKRESQLKSEGAARKGVIKDQGPVGRGAARGDRDAFGLGVVHRVTRVQGDIRDYKQNDDQGSDGAAGGDSALALPAQLASAQQTAATALSRGQHVPGPPRVRAPSSRHHVGAPMAVLKDMRGRGGEHRRPAWNDDFHRK